SSMNSIGYKQLRGYFEKTLDLDQTLEMLKRDTRHFAKRQITWFKRDKRINWCVSEEQAVALVGKFLQE
ncbi:MAG: tRNA dimethylallyltransferase, partial [Patescibacteria group bacterium]